MIGMRGSIDSKKMTAADFYTRSCMSPIGECSRKGGGASKGCDMYEGRAAVMVSKCT
jgi:hypothetical protein